MRAGIDAPNAYEEDVIYDSVAEERIRAYNLRAQERYDSEQKARMAEQEQDRLVQLVAERLEQSRAKKRWWKK